MGQNKIGILNVVRNRNLETPFSILLILVETGRALFHVYAIFGRPITTFAICPYANLRKLL